MLHADTSVLASRVFGEKQEREAASSALGDGPLCVCGYVLYELRATFLRDAALLYNLIRDRGDVAEALRRLEKYSWNRRGRRGREVFYDLLTGDWPRTPQDVLHALRALIRGELMRRLTEGASRLPDRILCSRAATVGEREGDAFNTHLHCAPAEPPACTVVQFVREHRRELESLANGPEELDAEVHEAFRDTAGEVARQPDEVRGPNCYGVLADAIIALECPEGARVCTTDRHFAPICRALGMPRPKDARPVASE